jgi:UV DNA damage repair endonuclease
MGVNHDVTCINIHVGAQTPDFEQIFRTNFARLSQTAQKLLAIENDEFSYGVDQTAKLHDCAKLTLDVHHHWIKTGNYILPDDAFIQTTIDSWRGARPKLHYAISREDLLVDHDPNVLPCFASLSNQGYKKGKLRAHSDSVWNNKTNEYVLGFCIYT